MLKVEIDLKAIQHNYRVLCSISAGQIMPVVKADAYGHGMEKTAHSLLPLGVQTFAVGTIDEGIALRQSLSGVGIYSLLGPLSPEDFHNVFEYRITPAVHSWFQLEQLVQNCPQGYRLKIGIKFDTGMGRLGFEPGQAAETAHYLAANPCLVPEMIISHLACADIPQMESRVMEQSRILDSICSVFSQAKFKVQKSLSNSAAILSFPSICKGVARPGIALYGGNPFAGTCRQDKGTSLKQAMSVKAPVLCVHDLARGQGISYGLTFVAHRDMRVAIIGCGYADGYSRSLSNKSWMVYNGKRLPVLGKVCMQLTAVDVTGAPELVPGDEVFILGGSGQNRIDIHELAVWWGTISYEVFCLLGKNHKSYTNGSS